MSIPKRYNPNTHEPRLQAGWLDAGTYHFDLGSNAPVYSIDTPPPTVSGFLHLGHVYSYSQTDFFARFWRMNGYNVFYPMGYDDNGLPTERLVERQLKITATGVGRQVFIEKCLEVSEEAEKAYQNLWQRLGLSIDWRYTYRTIDEHSRRTSQRSFIDLYNKGLAYRREAPAIWCPECQTAIAQAEVNDLARQSEYVTLPFLLDDGRPLEIATTRPELLPACVAVFVHPDDARYSSLVGSQCRVPLFGQTVPVMADPAADPEKGTGAVMCCTFGDTADVEWWYTHNLPLVTAIGQDGTLTAAAGDFAGLDIAEARRQIKQRLEQDGLLLGRQPTEQTVRVHERCDTPVEYIVTRQWFVQVLDQKERLIAAGEQIDWHPPHMQSRYRAWVENLNWDWCISRQRYFGVTFPVWYCDQCQAVMLPADGELPIDPTARQPSSPCECGSTEFTAEADVMDTWATSSLTPQIVGRWQANEALYDSVFPFSLRPQAHEIIRTWAFYTLVKSQYHFDALPWQNVGISGWGLAPKGSGKISKSRGGGPVAPMEMIERYSADAVRYWAASTSLGKDSVISEEKIQIGGKLVTKLWNVARFASRFLADYHPPVSPPPLSPADRWILSRTGQLVARITDLYRGYEYAAAKSEIEAFFWTALADNYLEMAKKRLYEGEDAAREGARYALYHALLVVVKLFAPILPHVTEAIYQGMFTESDGSPSIHTGNWPQASNYPHSEAADLAGDQLVAIATAVRRYKSVNSLALGSELARLQLATPDESLADMLRAAATDITSITRAARVEVTAALDANLERLEGNDTLAIGLEV